MRPIYIFDLDGTLADASHRLHFIQREQKDWRSFFAACVDDAPIKQNIETFQRLKDGGAEVWIWTGRSDEVRKETVAWLKKEGCWVGETWLSRWVLEPESLMMRKAGDHQPDDALKFGWLADLEPPERRRLTAVFEDRDRVVKMWRNFGVPCYQVCEGAF